MGPFGDELRALLTVMALCLLMIVLQVTVTIGMVVAIGWLLVWAIG